MASKEGRLGMGSEDTLSNPFTWLKKSQNVAEISDEQDNKEIEEQEKEVIKDKEMSKPKSTEKKPKDIQTKKQKATGGQPDDPDIVLSDKIEAEEDAKENAAGQVLDFPVSAQEPLEEEKSESQFVLSTSESTGEKGKETEEILPKKRNTSKDGLPHGWTRVTWVVKDEHAEIIRALHAWTDDEIKDIIFNIFENYFKKPNVANVIKEALAFSRRKKVSLKELE